MKIQVEESTFQDLAHASSLEWIETNGRGSYASSTVVGANTRRYHGLLVAALEPPVRRHVLLSRVEEVVEFGNAKAELGCNHYQDAVHPEGHKLQISFRLDPIPTFVWDVGERRIEKAVFLVRGEDTVVIRYSLLRGSFCSLRLRPFLAFRDYHELSKRNDKIDPTVRIVPGIASIKPYPDLPELHFHHQAKEISVRGSWWQSNRQIREEERGLDHLEDLFSPFEVRYNLSPRSPALLIASTSGQLKIEANRLEASERARRAATVAVSWQAAPDLTEPLALAADAYIVRRGDGSPTILAGYPWFTDWGRDTMIALPGLCLATGRLEEARDILIAFGKHLDKGMIPNRFPDSGEVPEYNNIDGTLWFAYAIGRYIARTRDARSAESFFLPALVEIVKQHRAGTRFGIGVDEDGLLRGGEDGVPLTWMDAKVDDWVVTPRRGKPVEVNALWIETLETTAELSLHLGRTREAREYAELARVARESFERRFWNEKAGCLFDVVDGTDGDDASIRPNQILAVSLPHPAIAGPRARAVVDVVQRELLTPFGLRTLSPKDPAYRGTYAGDRKARDAAYHQGTVWPWLLGAFVRAYLRVHDRHPARVAEAQSMVRPLLAHVQEAGLGHVSEIFDGDPPHTARGCVAQAWSVGELIALVSEDLRPAARG